APSRQTLNANALLCRLNDLSMRTTLPEPHINKVTMRFFTDRTKERNLRFVDSCLAQTCVSMVFKLPILPRRQMIVASRSFTNHHNVLGTEHRLHLELNIIRTVPIIILNEKDEVILDQRNC